MRICCGLPLWIVLTALLAGCATHTPAPVESRMPSAVPAVPQVARAGYYIVKRGDTLYSIALEAGHDYRDVAAWNKIDNPSRIQVGQELRVTPPEGSGPKPILAPSIEMRPLESGAVAALPPAVSDSAIKLEPKGGRIAYSEQAWNALQNTQAIASAPMPTPATSEPVSKPVDKLVIAAPVPAAPTKGDESVAWMWPISGKLLAGFSEATNKGLDLAGNLGDPIFAAAPGRVVYAGSGLPGYGNLVIIKHSNDYLSVYAHNQSILVKEGQSVDKAQKVATLGSSGTDKPKLHFEIRKQGKPVDPAKILPPR